MNNWKKCYNIKCKYAGKGIHNGYCHGDVCKLMEEKFKRGENQFLRTPVDEY